MPLTHPFPPLFDSEAKVLILGSFPSVKSRETNFFYGHPQNRFWKVMAEVLGFTDGGESIYVPQTVEEKTRMLKAGGIALWDTIRSCDITGSSDASITNVVPNDLSVILDNARIEKICCNGARSYEIFMKYTEPSVRKYGVRYIKLPSTSPANAAWGLKRLMDEWKRLLEI